MRKGQVIERVPKFRRILKHIFFIFPGVLAAPQRHPPADPGPPHLHLRLPLPRHPQGVQRGLPARDKTGHAQVHISPKKYRKCAFEYVSSLLGTPGATSARSRPRPPPATSSCSRSQVCCVTYLHARFRSKVTVPRQVKCSLRKH